MSKSNVTWGAPRIRNELGIEVAVSTIARYMVRQRKPPSPSWRAFLDNHVKDPVAIDFFAVPTATFGVLFGFLVLAHDRRRVLHFNVTANPSAEWTARQVVQAFPEETGPYTPRSGDSADTTVRKGRVGGLPGQDRAASLRRQEAQRASVARQYSIR